MLIITGGAGFIGSALLWQLNEMGRDDIVIVDNLASTEKWRNLVKRSYADYWHRDLFIKHARAGSLPWRVDAIIHLGACSSTTEADADFLIKNNFHYSRDLCLYALERGIRFINASSAATYGNGENGFNDDPETVKKLHPLNMYGYSKQLFDLWLLKGGHDSQAASLKFFNVYGPNEYHKGAMRSVVAKFYEEISATGRARLFASNRPGLPDGAQQRDFVYVKDCVRLIAWLLEKKSVNGIRNVGTGNPASFRELAGAVFGAMGRQEAIDYIPMPSSLSRNYQNYTCARMDWLKEEGYPYEFRNIQAGAEDYIKNHLAREDRYL